MVVENLVDQDVGRFHGRREQRQDYKSGRLGKTVIDSEDDCIIVVRGRPVTKSSAMCDQG